MGPGSRALRARPPTQGQASLAVRPVHVTEGQSMSQRARCTPVGAGGTTVVRGSVWSSRSQASRWPWPPVRAKTSTIASGRGSLRRGVPCSFGGGPRRPRRVNPRRGAVAHRGRALQTGPRPLSEGRPWESDRDVARRVGQSGRSRRAAHCALAADCRGRADRATPRGPGRPAPGGHLVVPISTRAHSATALTRRPGTWTAATARLGRSGTDIRRYSTAALDGYGYRLRWARALTAGRGRLGTASSRRLRHSADRRADA